MRICACGPKFAGYGKDMVIKMENEKTELKVIRMSEIETQEIKWLWYPFIPYGKLTIVQGDPGDGKTTMILNLVAQLSKGKCFEEGSGVDAPMKVIYQTAEDGLADTVKPRLEKPVRIVSRFWLLMRVINPFL